MGPATLNSRNHGSGCNSPRVHGLAGGRERSLVSSAWQPGALLRVRHCRVDWGDGDGLTRFFLAVAQKRFKQIDVLKSSLGLRCHVGGYCCELAEQKAVDLAKTTPILDRDVPQV